MIRITKKIIRKGDFNFSDLARLTDRKFDLQVGIQPERGSVRKADYYGRRSSESLTEVAKKHEFGSGTIPERSFLRSTFEKNENKYRMNIIHNVRAAAMSKRGKILATRKALNELGEMMVKDIKRTIMSFIPPTLSEKTMRNRRSAGVTGFRPLLATRQLYEAISHKVKVTK